MTTSLRAQDLLLFAVVHWRRERFLSWYSPWRIEVKVVRTDLGEKVARKPSLPRLMPNIGTLFFIQALTALRMVPSPPMTQQTSWPLMWSSSWDGFLQILYCVPMDAACSASLAQRSSAPVLSGFT